MTCGRGDSRAKLRAVIAIEGIDSVCAALRLDFERIRAMNDGTGEIDAESAAWIDSEVLRLEAAGLLVEVTETLEPEGIGSDDATPTAEAAELTVPEAGPHDVEDPREALRAIVEGVLQRAIFIIARVYRSKYEMLLANLLRCRLELQLQFRRPLSTGRDMMRESAEDRERSIGRWKGRLRGVEDELKKKRGLWHWLKKPLDFSGDELYHRLILEWCESMEADAEVALRVGLKGIGKFLYPESYGNTTRQLTRLDEGKRRAAEALIEAVMLAEEVEFRSPLPCEENLASAEIKNRMELILIMELGVAPPPYNADESVRDYTDMAGAKRKRERMVELRRNRLAWVDEERRACKGYKGLQTAVALFHQLIEESGAEECRRLNEIMKLDMQMLCRSFHAGSTVSTLGTLGFFNSPDVQPGPGN